MKREVGDRHVRSCIGYTVPASSSLRDVAGAKPAISKWQLAISQTAERFGREFQDGSRRREGTAGETRQELICVPAVQDGNFKKCCLKSGRFDGAKRNYFQR